MILLDVVEHLLVALNDSVGSVDDSDGHLGGLFETAADLHLRAGHQGEVPLRRPPRPTLRSCDQR